MGIRAKTSADAQVSENVTTCLRRQMSREEQIVREAIAVLDAESEKSIESLRISVRNGTYDCSVEEIAEAIIATERFEQSIP